MKKIVLTCMMAIFLFVGMPKTAHAEFNPDIRKSVVKVYTCMDIKNVKEGGLGSGTGFFIGKEGENPKYLITNHHVIERFLQTGAGELVQQKLSDGTVITARSKIRVYFDDYSTKDYVEAYLVEADETKDIALLKLDSPTDRRQPLPICIPDDSMVGSDVYAVGYPSLADNVLAEPVEEWGVNDSTVTNGVFSRLLTTEGTGRSNLQIDCVIRHGNSGGPLVDKDGAVLGVTTWGKTGDYEDDETVFYAVNIEEVLVLLDKYHVEYDVVGAKSGLEGTARETDSTAAGSVETPEISETPKKESNTGMWIGIILAVVAAGAAGVMIITRGNKNQKVQEKPAVVPEGSAPARKRPIVRSMSPQHQGMQVTVLDRPILIGRSKVDCAIVFREDTPGVSGRHCSLSWDADSASFVLTDLKSTYGTYLQSGEKLKCGAPYYLKAGECFYLGEPANMFSVNLE